MAQSQDEKDEVSLPAILCLHAYGTNAAIFRYQLRHITQALTGIFRFIFVEAPFHVQQPGPGVPSGFMDAGPFRRWHSDNTLAGAFGVSSSNLREEKRQVRELLRDTLESERRRAAQGSGVGVVGVVAFSQGAALGAALCLHPELGADIKFVVILCALYPALSLMEDDDDAPSSGVAQPSKKSSGPQLVIEIPSIHVQGTSDPWRGQGTKTLEQYFDGTRATRIELAGLRHEVPVKVKEVAMVADEVVAIWKSDREEGEG
jgi:pimeloyl-ACP methyl ester carboxylesterase